MTAALRLTVLASCAAALGAGGCRSEGEPATQPAGQRPATTLLAPESRTWTRDEAAARLEDPRIGLSAAVRLVELADLDVLCLPAERTDDHVRRLRLLRLDERRWALGLAEPQDERRLRAAVLIAADGQVTPLAEGTDEELLVLHVSADAEVFPHVAVLPARVLLLDQDVEDAIVLAPQQRVRFELRRRSGYGYIALVLAEPGRDEEVAEYRWAPYELVFLGPAVDKLPDPPGGKFHVDLEASRRLEPYGGEVPEPEPIEREPQPRRDLPV